MTEVVLDSDFLSSFLKIEQLHLVRDFFHTEILWIPPAVHREVAVTSLLPRMTSLEWVRVREVARHRFEELLQDSEFQQLGAGERESIALARGFHRSVLLMNDKRASRCAEGLKVDVINIPAFLLAYRRSGDGTLPKIKELIDALQKEDHYGFSNDVLDLLLS